MDNEKPSSPSPACQPFGESQSQPKVYSNLQEYCEALKSWIQSAVWYSHQQQQASLLYSVLKTPHLTTSTTPISTSASSIHTNNYGGSSHSFNLLEEQAKRLAEEHVARQMAHMQHVFGQPSPTGTPPTAATTNGNTQTPTPNGRTADIPIQGARYDVAPPWKRVAAELMDYMILMILKVLFLMVVNREWNVLNLLTKVDLDFRMLSSRHGLFSGENGLFYESNEQSTPPSERGNLFSEANDQLSFEFINPDILLAEMLNRVFVTLYEAVLISQCGATFGKSLLGLEVVACREVIDLPEGRVEAVPAGRCTFWSALLRSAIKNCALIFCFPVCLTTLFFQHYRATYDLIAASLVVQRPLSAGNLLRPQGRAAPQPAQ